MEHKIRVRIKTGEFVDVLDLSRASRGTLHLTTVEDFQTAAEIPVYLFSGEEPRLLKTLTVDRLEPVSSEDCRLDLQCRVRGRNRAEFRVVQNGRLLSTEAVRLPIRGSLLRVLASAAILAVLAAAAVAAVLLLRGCPPPGAAARGAPPGASSTARAAPAPAPVSAPSPAAEAGPSVAEVPGPSASESSGTGTPAPAGSSVPSVASAAASPAAAGRSALLALGEEALTVYFGPDSSEIPRDQTGKLSRIAALLARYPDLAVSISGHCATAGTEKGRRALSQDRARAVYRALVRAGWTPLREPEVRGFGDERPASTAEDEQALNRRVEIRLSS